MSKQATVTNVKFNFEKTFKNGKSFTGTELCFLMDSGSAKKEFLFSNVSYMDVVKNLAVGDVIDVTYVKKGEYFNLDNISLISKGTGTVGSSSTAFSTGGSYTSKSSGGSYGGKDPEIQAAIIRQNALTNSVSLITKSLEQGLYKKTTTIDLLKDEIFRIAKDFAAFSSGELQIKDLKADLSSIPKPEDDIPFEGGSKFGE